MKYRDLGRTGLQVSEIGFGCGAVGGLMVRGDRKEMVRAAEWAIAQGINYFDTARIYGNGQSETNLGWVLKELGADVVVGTKLKLEDEDLDRIEEAVIEHAEGSLKRLGRESVEIYSLHHGVSFQRQPGPGWLAPGDLEQVAKAMQTLIEQGKIRAWGMNGLGETDAIHKALETFSPFGIQACFNLLNPSAGARVPEGFPFQDYKGLIDVAAAQQAGVFAIRVLAAGALSGAMDRHANAAQNVAPIATGRDYADDVARAKAFDFLVSDGYVDNLVEAAIRFVISNDKVSTALIGLSSFEQLEQAVEYGNKGPLPQDALECLQGVWSSFADS